MTWHDLENGNEFMSYEISGSSYCSDTLTVGIITIPNRLGG